MCWRRRDLTGDVVVITGGGMGLGRATALQFAAMGCKIAFWNLNPTNGLAVQAEIQAAGGDAAFFEADVTDQEKVNAMAKLVEERFGRVDILVNNAGFVGGKPIGEWDPARIQRCMSVNLLAHFWTINAFLPGMIARNKGYLVEIASAAGIFGGAGMCEYGAAKSGVIGLATSIRGELRGRKIDGVHTLVVCPSYISTGMFEGIKVPKTMSWLPPEYVARRIVKGVQKNKHEIIMPRMLHLLRLSVAILPDSLVQWMLNSIDAFNGMDTFNPNREYLGVTKIQEETTATSAGAA